MTPNEKRLQIEIGRALMRLHGSVELQKAIISADAERHYADGRAEGRKHVAEQRAGEDV